MAGRVLRGIKGTYDRILLSLYGVKKVDNKLLLDDGLQETTPNPDVQKEMDYVRSKEDLQAAAPIVLKDLWKIFPPSVGIMGSFFGSIKWLICCCGLGLGRSSNPEEKKQDQSKPRRAVRGLTTAVKRGETFGLLGSNGAGKTTTLGML